MKSETAISVDRDALLDPDLADEVIRRITRAISGVRYGSVEVVIQDSRVVQIERKEKFRFDKVSRS